MTKRIKKNYYTPYDYKKRIEQSISYNKEKLTDLPILFANKNDMEKNSYSDFKIFIAQELYMKTLVAENIKKELINKYQKEEYDKKTLLYSQRKESKQEKVVIIEEEEKQEVVAPKKVKKIKIKVDSNSIIEKIKEESRIKNEGKEIINRSMVNKMLAPKEVVIEEIIEKIEEVKVEEVIIEKPIVKKVKKAKVKVDSSAIIARIKAESMKKNEGKPIMDRRKVNFLVEKQNERKRKRMLDLATLGRKSSIDIYLNALEQSIED